MSYKVFRVLLAIALFGASADLMAESPITLGPAQLDQITAGMAITELNIPSELLRFEDRLELFDELRNSRAPRVFSALQIATRENSNTLAFFAASLNENTNLLSFLGVSAATIIIGGIGNNPN